jgi:molybdopterin adenylyltransferase
VDGAADEQGCPLIVTTGDASPAPRNVTPEVTEAMYDRILPGFGEVTRAVSLHTTPMAILSRQTAGTRGRSLIVSLSGKLSAIAECLDAVLPATARCIDLIDGPRLVTDPAACVALRPEGA